MELSLVLATITMGSSPDIQLGMPAITHGRKDLEKASSTQGSSQHIR